MKIAIFSALDHGSRSGNWVTASRWQQLLRQAGHRVSILHRDEEVDSSRADVLIGLHARRSSKALLRFKKHNPQSSTMVTLTGTDIYRDLAPTRKQPPALAVRSLDACNRIILLQPLMANRLKAQWRSKSSVVMMDAIRHANSPKRLSFNRPLRVCVVSHMRTEKDSLRAAMAVRSLPKDVSVEVTHAGKALSDSLYKRASREAQQNVNWNWLESVSHKKVQQLMKGSDLLINSSRAEGAPNVLFEAISWRLPVIASKIDGHVGVLGKAYPGCFKVGDTEQLNNLLIRCCRSESFYQKLLDFSETLANQFRPGTEQKELLRSICLAIESQK